MTDPAIKGWCPGAWRPMLSGDGLVLRVRPAHGRLTADQVRGLCALARTQGNGMIDLTRRANLQMRGLDEADLPDVLARLGGLDLLDPSPEIEARRNILVQPFWSSGDVTHRLTMELLARLAELPDLPTKFGFAIDTGPRPVLTGDSADLRLEAPDGRLHLRRDGEPTGPAVREDAAIDAVLEAAHAFAAHPKRTQPRMARFLAQDLGLAVAAPAVTGEAPGHARGGAGLVGGGVLFGQTTADDLVQALDVTRATALRLSPWRVVYFEDGRATPPAPFRSSEDPLLTRLDACPGAPACAAASLATRDIARDLGPRIRGSLHVSGCAKGCARSRPAEVTLVARDGAFDLVRQGHAWDKPAIRALAPEDIPNAVS